MSPLAIVWLKLLRLTFFLSLFLPNHFHHPTPKHKHSSQRTITKNTHTHLLQLSSTMSQPEQQLHPLDRKEDEKTTSTVGEKISHLGEKLSGTTLGGDNSSKEKTATDTTAFHGLPSKEEATVRCLADFAIYPMGTTASFQKHIDEVESVLKRCGMSIFFLLRSLLLVVRHLWPTVCWCCHRLLSWYTSTLTNKNNYFLAFVCSSSFPFFALRSGVDYKIHAQCTTMEGEMGAIMYAVKSCHEALHAMGCPRIASKYVFHHFTLSS